MVEGKDTYEKLSGAMRELNDAMKTHSDDQSIWHIGGGDGMWVQACLGMYQSYSCEHSCPYCLVHQNSLHKLTQSTPRTLAMAKRMTHTADLPFYCEGCDKWFTTQEDIDASEPTTDAAQIRYRRAHYGWCFKTAPILDIEPKLLFVCSLHLKLAVGRKIFSYAINECINTKTAPILASVLKQYGINYEPQGPSSTDAKASLKTVRLNGKEVDNFFENVEEITSNLDAVPGHQQNVLQAVNLFEDAYSYLTTSDPMTSAIRSAQVKSRAIKFAKCMKRWIGDAGINFYIHHLVVHVPDQIAILPNNFPFQHVSAIGLEAQNKLTKRMIRQHCNNHTATRTAQALRRITTTNLSTSSSDITSYQASLAIKKGRARQQYKEKTGKRKQKHVPQSLEEDISVTSEYGSWWQQSQSITSQTQTTTNQSQSTMNPSQATQDSRGSDLFSGRGLLP